MGLIDYHQLPNFDLFGLVLLHLSLTTWALSGYGNGNSYLFYNIIFLFVLIWCIKDSQNEIPLILAIKINITSIIFDFVILLWLIFTYDQRGYSIFAMVGCFVHLIFRFVSVPLLSKMCSDKTGGLNDGLPAVLTPIFGVEPGLGPHDPYENIDNVPHQSYPKTEPVINPSQSYNFSSNVPTYQA